MSSRRRVPLIAMLWCIAVAVIALATPWAEPFRRAIRPQLPLYVVVLALFSAVAQLVVGVVQAMGKQKRWRSSVVPFSLGASAFCMALAFLPGGTEPTPRLFPILGAALFAVTAAALQRRARERSDV